MFKLFLTGFFLLLGDTVGVNGGEPTADRLIEERLDDDFKFGFEDGFFLLGDLGDVNGGDAILGADVLRTRRPPRPAGDDWFDDAIDRLVDDATDGDDFTFRLDEVCWGVFGEKGGDATEVRFAPLEDTGFFLDVDVDGDGDGDDADSRAIDGDLCSWSDGLLFLVGDATADDVRRTPPAETPPLDDDCFVMTDLGDLVGDCSSFAGR